MWRIIQIRFCSQQIPNEMTVRVKSLRIDNFVAKTSSLSRNKCRLAIEAALIGIDGVPVVKPSQEVQAGVVIDHIKQNEEGMLKLMRWQNIEIEEVDNPKPNGTKYEITFDLIKSMEIPLNEYKDNVQKAVEIELGTIRAEEVSD